MKPRAWGQMPELIARAGWTEHMIGGHPVHFYIPDQPHPHGYTVLFLHDVDEQTLRDQPQALRVLSQAGLRVVAPQAGRTWWLDHLVPEFDAARSSISYLREVLVPELAACLQVVPPRIGLLGVGMGGQGALTLAYRFPRQFPVVAALAPAVDFHQLVPHDDPLLTEVFGSREWARQHTPILHVHPLNWPPHQFFCCDPTNYLWFDSSDRLRMKLNSIGVPCTCDLETTVEREAWDYYDQMMPRTVQFIVEGLERERLRIV